MIAMLTCKEISRSIASDELASAGWRKHWSIKLHLMMCRYCRRYSREIEAIGTATRRVFGSAHSDPGARERLRDSILERIPPAREDERDSEV